MGQGVWTVIDKVDSNYHPKKTNLMTGTLAFIHEELPVLPSSVHVIDFILSLTI